MRLLLPLAAFLTLAVLLIGQQGQSSAVTYVSHDKVETALAKGGPLFAASDFTVSGSHRKGPGGVEVHDHETDIMYIVDGEATLVTGGTMVGGKSTKAGQWLGTDIQGGQTQHVSKGDVVVVPAGIPHWFKEVPGPISYYVVKVIK